LRSLDMVLPGLETTRWSGVVGVVPAPMDGALGPDGTAGRRQRFRGTDENPGTKGEIQRGGVAGRRGEGPAGMGYPTKNNKGAIFTSSCEPFSAARDAETPVRASAPSGPLVRGLDGLKREDRRTKDHWRRLLRKRQEKGRLAVVCAEGPTPPPSCGAKKTRAGPHSGQIFFWLGVRGPPGPPWYGKKTRGLKGGGWGGGGPGICGFGQGAGFLG